MGQEMYTMFPALGEMQARSQLMKAQAASEGFRGQEYQLAADRFRQQNAADTAFGNAGMQGGFAGSPVPGGPVAQTPAPGQASMPSAPGFQPFQPAPAGIRVPPAGGPAMGVQPPSSAPGTVDEIRQPGDSGDLYPKAAQPPAPAQPGAPHKWAAAPGEQHNTPDGSRPRSLDEVFAALKKANPKADPATLARAAAMYMPWMTEEDQVRLKEAQMQTNTLIAEGNRDAASARVKETQLAISERADANRTSREKIAQMNISGREKLALLKNDVAYAAQKQRADEADRKADIALQVLEQTKSRDAQTAYFKALAAKNDANYNLASIMYANHDLTDEDKTEIFNSIKEENAAAVAAGKQYNVSGPRVGSGAVKIAPVRRNVGKSNQGSIAPKGGLFDPTPDAAAGGFN